MYRLSGACEERLTSRQWTLNIAETENKKKSSLFHLQWCFFSWLLVHNVFLSTFPQYSELQIILMWVLDNTVLLFLQKEKLYFFFKTLVYAPHCLEERHARAAGLIVFLLCLWELWWSLTEDVLMWSAKNTAGVRHQTEKDECGLAECQKNTFTENLWFITSFIISLV